jgi:hypothetical protein
MSVPAFDSRAANPSVMNHRGRQQHGSSVNFLTDCIFWTTDVNGP